MNMNPITDDEITLKSEYESASAEDTPSWEAESDGSTAVTDKSSVLDMELEIVNGSRPSLQDQQLQPPFMQGTFEQLREYIRLRLKLALTISRDTLITSTCSQRGLDCDKVVDRILQNILFCGHIRLGQDEQQRQPQQEEEEETKVRTDPTTTQSPKSSHEPVDEYRNAPEPSENPSSAGVEARALFEEASRAWQFLASVQNSNGFRSDVAMSSHTPPPQLENAAMECDNEQEKIITFPSSYSIDCLCELLILGVTAGAVLGYEAISQSGADGAEV